MLASLLLDCLLACLIWRMVVQAHAYRSLPEASGDALPAWPTVAVIVPARDEADVIGRCVAGLIEQDYPADRFSLRVVDDGSHDGTGDVAREAARGDLRFRLVRGTDVPEGWTGKAHACHQGVLASGQSDYLCFMDADTAAAPALLRSAVAYAVRNGLGMLSLGPRQDLGTILERLVIPCGLYLVAASQDIAASNDPTREVSAANGQFLLLRGSVYETIGGHAAVRSEICEDLALARMVRRAGLGYVMLGAESLIRCRMYRRPGDLWQGLAKNAVTTGGGTARTVLIAGAGLTGAVASLVLPVLAAIRLVNQQASLEHVAAALPAFLGLSCAVALHVAGARHFRIPPAYGLLFPLGYALVFALAIESARRHRSGRVTWKDRAYGLAPERPPDNDPP